MSNVCVLGLWHLGLVAAASLADMGYEVTGSDIDSNRVREISKGKLPLFEPGLEDLIRKHSESNKLLFNESLEKAVANASTVLITYDTPVDDQDQIDLSQIETTLRKVTPHLQKNSLIIVQSQIPIGTCRKWKDRLQALRPSDAIEIACSPENLRLGNALDLYQHPDMIVIGTQNQNARLKAEAFFKSFGSPCFWVNWETAELTKHALNTFFATSISFANELGRLCELAGADGLEIAKILKADRRIGAKAQVRPGLGFSGATLARDVRCLQTFAEEHGAETPVLDAVMQINETQVHFLIKKLEHHFRKNLKGLRFAIFGLTYKAGTSTLRRSASLELIRQLQSQGALCHAQDPMANLDELTTPLNFSFTRDPLEAVQGADGILLMTEWEIYQKLDYAEIAKRLRYPLILDTKNHLNRNLLDSLKFHYLEIGRP